MSQPPANTPIPNPAFLGLPPRKPQNDEQASLFAQFDPKTPLTIERRLGTRYAAA